MNYGKRLLIFSVVASFAGLLSGTEDTISAPEVTKTIAEEIRESIEAVQDTDVTVGKIDVKEQKTQEVSVQKKIRRELKKISAILSVMIDSVVACNKEDKYVDIAKKLIGAKKRTDESIRLLKEKKIDIALAVTEIQTIPVKANELPEVVDVQQIVPEEVKIQENVKPDEGLKDVAAGEPAEVVAEPPVITPAEPEAKVEFTSADKKAVEKSTTKKDRRGRAKISRTGKTDNKKASVKKSVSKAPVKKTARVK